MRLLVVPESVPQRNAASKPRVWKWWLPYTCGRGLGLRVGGDPVPRGCGARGCVRCHRAKLRRFTSGVGLVPRQPGEVGIHARFTPEKRVKTRDDVRDFLVTIRRLTYEWRRYYGLGAAWWVAEVTGPKVEEEPTAIPCPFRHAWDADELPTLDDLRGDLPVADWLLDRCADCAEGKCTLCLGRGVLPAVHLHVHLVGWARPFWYGKGEAPAPPPGADRWEDFGGRGWAGFVEDHGLGHDQVERLRSEGGVANYIAKGAIHYIAKSGEEKDGRGQVDWDVSQLQAELAAAIYGPERARGKKGRANGITISRKRPGVEVEFGARCEQQRPPDALLARRDELGAQVEADRARKKAIAAV